MARSKVLSPIKMWRTLRPVEVPSAILSVWLAIRRKVHPDSSREVRTTSIEQVTRKPLIERAPLALCGLGPRNAVRAAESPSLQAFNSNLVPISENRTSARCDAWLKLDL